MPDVLDLLVASDCGVLTVSQNPPAGTVLPIGTNLVSLVAADACGNQTTSVVAMVVVDEVSPTVTSVLRNYTLASSNDIPAANPSIVNALDACSTFSVVHAGDIGNGGAGTVGSPLVLLRLFRAIDAWGNIVETQQTFTVDGVGAPVPPAPTNLAFRVLGSVTGAQAITVSTLGTNSWTVRPEYTTNLSGAPVWTVISNYNNVWANGTNTTSFAVPTNARPLFLRFFQTYP
jgi:hypothetical protein